MAQNVVKENPNIYIFLALVFIIVSIILIAIELNEYGFFSSDTGSNFETTVTTVIIHSPTITVTTSK